MPLDVLGCTRATLIHVLNEFMLALPIGLGQSVRRSRAG